MDKENEYNRKNEPSLYCDPIKLHEMLVNKFEDMELNAIADARLNDGKPFIRVNLDFDSVGKGKRSTVYRAVTAM